jgi:hypothetical protein
MDRSHNVTNGFVGGFVSRQSSVKRGVARVTLCALLCIPAVVARADTLDLGVLSFDTFIPGNENSPGINAFNIGNFTGGFSLLPDFPVTDSLVFQGATLELFPVGNPSQLLALGDIGEGFLSDLDGDPLVQVVGDQMFTGADFTATLSALQFMLADGSVFIADSSFINIALSPSNGNTLRADNEQAIITVSGSRAAAIPEPAGAVLLLTGLLLCLACGLRQKYFQKFRS